MPTYMTLRKYHWHLEEGMIMKIEQRNFFQSFFGNLDNILSE